MSWFLVLVGNTRVITQSALQAFQDEMGKVMKDPYKVCVGLDKCVVCACVCVFCGCKGVYVCLNIHTGSDEADRITSLPSSGKVKGQFSLIHPYLHAQDK